jgi:lambda family phage tail tape measure protein
MATETVGVARVDVIVNTDQFDTAIAAAKRSVSDMSSAAQEQYNRLNASEKRRIDSLLRQAQTLGFTREQQIAYNAALRGEGPLLDEITRKLRASTAATKAQSVEFNRYGLSAKQNAAALRQVPAQLTDIFTGLAGGQNPLLVLLQQGGQLRDVFGGIAPAARALGGALLGLINPFTLTAAAVAGLYLAFEQGRDQAREFDKALILTGNAAGTTTDELIAQARELDNLSDTTQREAAAALAQIAATGQFTAEQINLVATAALQMQAATGKAVEETVAEFSKLRKDPVAAILELNEQYHFLTQAQLDNINTLKESGRETDAVTEAFRVYAGTIGDRAPQIQEQVWGIERAFRGLKSGASEAWDAVVNGIANADRQASEAIGTFGRLLAYARAGAPGGLFGLQAAMSTPVPVRGGATRSTTVDSAQAKKALEERKKAEEEFARLELSNLSKRQKLEKEIKDIRELGLKAGKSEAEIEKQIAQARARYAESLPKGRKKREETDPTDAILARVRQQIALNEEQAKSEDTLTASERLRVQVLQQLEELGAKASPQRRAEIQALLDQAVATDALVQKQKAEAEAKKDLARLTAQLAAEEENVRRGIEIDLMSIGRGGEAAEMLRRQLDIQRELADGLDAIKRDAEGKSAKALQAEEDALRLSIERRLEMEREYQMQRQALQADWRNGMNAAVENFMADASNVAASTQDFIESTLNGMADATAAYASGTKDAFGDLLDDIYRQSVRFLAQQAIQKLLKAFGGNDGDVVDTAINLFSSGNTGGGFDFGFASGGYTGDGARLEPAGIVHRGEYVLNQNATRAMGRDWLDQINSGRVPAMGGTTLNFHQTNNFDRNNSQATPEQIAMRTGRAAQRELARTG